MTTFGERLKALMDGAGVSVRELSERTGMPAASIFPLLNGRVKNPTLSSISRILTFFPKDAYWLCTGQRETGEAMEEVEMIPLYHVEFGAGDRGEPTWGAGARRRAPARALLGTAGAGGLPLQRQVGDGGGRQHGAPHH